LRAVKTYVQFLRQSANIVDEDAERLVSSFDEQCLTGLEPWPRLFWRSRMAGSELRKRDVLTWSETVEAGGGGEVRCILIPGRHEFLAGEILGKFSLMGRRSGVERVLDTVLETKLSEGWARKMALTGVRGVPLGGVKERVQ